MKIGGMGGLEIIIILVVILIIFGPKNLPKLGNAIGKTLSNLRAGMNEGKKKDSDDSAKTEEAAKGESAQPAEIEGTVEDASEAAEDAGGAEAKDEAAEADAAEATQGDVIDSAEDAVADAEAAAEEAFQTKTVKRVVKKRVVEEPAE